MTSEVRIAGPDSIGVVPHARVCAAVLKRHTFGYVKPTAALSASMFT
jgi:hypothetical protein